MAPRFIDTTKEMKGTSVQGEVTPQRYRDLIAEFGLSQVDAATFLRVDERTSRRWASGEVDIPASVILLFEVMLAKKMTTGEVQRMMRKKT